MIGAMSGAMIGAKIGNVIAAEMHEDGSETVKTNVVRGWGEKWTLR